MVGYSNDCNCSNLTYNSDDIKGGCYKWSNERWENDGKKHANWSCLNDLKHNCDRNGGGWVCSGDYQCQHNNDSIHSTNKEDVGFCGGDTPFGNAWRYSYKCYKDPSWMYTIDSDANKVINRKRCCSGEASKSSRACGEPYCQGLDCHCKCANEEYCTYVGSEKINGNTFWNGDKNFKEYCTKNVKISSKSDDNSLQIQYCTQPEKLNAHKPLYFNDKTWCSEWCENNKYDCYNNLLDNYCLKDYNTYKSPECEKVVELAKFDKNLEKKISKWLIAKHCDLSDNIMSEECQLACKTHVDDSLCEDSMYKYCDDVVLGKSDSKKQSECACFLKSQVYKKFENELKENYNITGNISENQQCNYPDCVHSKYYKGGNITCPPNNVVECINKISINSEGDITIGNLNQSNNCKQIIQKKESCTIADCNNKGTTSGYKDSNGKCKCDCNDGYFGENCSTECLSTKQCNGNGNASFENGKCICKCNDGWGGSDCKTPTQCVKSQDCNESNTQSVTGRKGSCDCKCKEGFKGDKCEEVDLCVKSEDCNNLNTDSVSGKKGSCECKCKDGFTGSKCDSIEECVKSEDCDENNTESVSGQKGSCQCKCKDGFKGDRCTEKASCKEYNNCNKDGTESVEGDFAMGQGCTCNCNSEYEGERCEKKIQACNVYSDCNESGTSSVEGNRPDCNCICKVGFYGDKCEIDDSKICLNDKDCIIFNFLERIVILIIQNIKPIYNSYIVLPLTTKKIWVYASFSLLVLIILVILYKEIKKNI